jgi:hypothetical protein
MSIQRRRLTNKASKTVALCFLMLSAPTLAASAETILSTRKAPVSARTTTGIDSEAGKQAAKRISPASAASNTGTQTQTGATLEGSRAQVPSMGRVPADMDAARGLRDAKDMGDSLRGMGRNDGNLTQPGGVDLGKARSSDSHFNRRPPLEGNNTNNARLPEGMPKMPTLPSNQDKRPGSIVGSPSHNLRDHMRGSTSQDNKHGRLVGYQSDGGVVSETGTVYSRETRLYEDGYTETTVFSQHRDGSSTVQTIRTDLDANTQTSESVHRDRNGNVTDVQRIVTEADPRSGENIARTQDSNADANDGSACRAMPWACRGAPVRDVTLVNPGRDSGGFAPASTMNPGGSIVINPSTETVRQANQTRPVDPAGARRAVDGGTQVNPPGPSD